MRSDWLRALERLGVPVSPALRAALSAVAHTNPSLDQVGFRGYADDAAEGSRTPKAAENVAWTQDVDETFILRVAIDETAGGTENNVSLQLQCRLNAGTWQDVTTTSTIVQAVDAVNMTGGTQLGQTLLTSGTGTRIRGEACEDGLADTSKLSYAGGEVGEIEYAVQVVGADVAHNDTVELRVVRSGGTLEAWTQVPSLTVNEGAAPIAVGLATETDSAFSVIPSKRRAVGLGSETTGAFPVATAKARALGLAATAETALTLTAGKRRVVGLATESDIALALVQQQTVSVGMAVETDAALALGATKGRAVSLVTETASARPMAAAKDRALGLVFETAAAWAVSWTKAAGVGLAWETAAALGATPAKSRTVGLALETDVAFAVLLTGEPMIGLASELDIAFAVSAWKTRTVGFASTVDTAMGVVVSTPLAIPFLLSPFWATGPSGITWAEGDPGITEAIGSSGITSAEA